MRLSREAVEVHCAGWWCGSVASCRANNQPVPVTGFLLGGTPDGYAPVLTAFRQNLKEAGWVDGHNVMIEIRWADGHYDRPPAMTPVASPEEFFALLHPVNGNVLQ